jgi:hypothetical protein
MAITYPTSPKFRAIDLKMVDPTVVFRAQSGKRVSRKVGGQYWSFTLTYPPLKDSEFSPVRGAVVRARGQYETFTVIPPNLATPQGTQTADTVVAASTAIGNTSIPISGATIGATIKSGDVLKFSNHAKVYMIVEDTVADGAGLATLTITPPLITAITITTTTVKHANVPFTVALTNAMQEIKTDVAGFNRYELDVEEVF